MAIQDFTAGQVLTAAQMDSLQANDYNQTVSTKTASYVLVAADKGTRIAMNAAGATTITVNTSLFDAGDTLFIQNIGAGTCTITAGTATVTTASSLALAQWGGGTLYFTSASAAIFFSGGAPAYGTATGGIGSPTAVTIGGVNYQYLTFNSTGTLTVTKSGFFDYLLVSGGQAIRKAGTGLNPSRGGGGGGGVVLIGSIYLDANQTITIGAGASLVGNYDDLATSNPTTLAATSPFTQTAARAISKNTAGTGRSEARGYSSGGSLNATTSENFTSDLGKKGGSSSANTNGGGGGGWTANGGDGTSTTGGAGGAGFDVSVFIGGSEVRKAMGGGGGGSVTGGAAATGGVAGNTTTGNNGIANSGGGGGGGAYDQSDGNGGSGIAYIRFKV